MVEMKRPAVVLIGDLVGSRRSRDRSALHGRLGRALERANRMHGGELRITAGDEYQGRFDTVGDALRATLTLRLALLRDADVRHGIGCGDVESLDDRVEDGPGWWAARDAIEAAARAERRAATRSLRTAYRLAPDTTGPAAAAVNAALLGRDELVGRLSGRGVSVLRGLLAGRTQAELATDEGVSASAISQRVRNDGIGVLLAMDRGLGGVR